MTTSNFHRDSIALARALGKIRAQEDEYLRKTVEKELEEKKKLNTER